MSKVKTSFTPKEEALIPVYLDKYIKQQTEQVSREETVDIINKLWDRQGLKPPKVIIKESPAACKNACGDRDFSSYWSLWHCSYAAMYDFGREIGIEMDQESLEIFLAWCKCCPFIMFDEHTVYVSRKPVELYYDDENRLHNEEGMSCRFEDDWGVWSINGVSVDEQVVMDPKSQTIKQIQDENNEEVKRIRIERYGWIKYLEQIDAKLIDYRDNAIDGVEEQLYSFNDGEGRVMLCLCNSQGKEFALEWNNEVNTCEEMQKAISSGLSSRTIASS